MAEDAPAASPEGAPRARLRFSPPWRELLFGIVQRVHAAQAAAPDEPSVAPREPPDPELLAAWSESLRETEEQDTAALLGLLANAKFGVVDLLLSPVAAEAVMRAAVRVRLHLRETLLRDLGTAQIEGGADIYGLPPVEQQGYACYRLLAHLEEDLLAQLDPGVLGS